MHALQITSLHMSRRINASQLHINKFAAARHPDARIAEPVHGPTAGAIHPAQQSALIILHLEDLHKQVSGCLHLPDNQVQAEVE